MKSVKPVIADARLVAHCGLYCGACPRLLKGACPGCAENDKATWCGVRNCCRANGHPTCADCREFADVMACKKFNNLISRIFGLVFRSDRRACVEMIRERGVEGFARHMAEHRLASLRPKRG